MIDQNSMSHLAYSLSFYLSNKNVKSIDKNNISKALTFPRVIYDQYFISSVNFSIIKAIKKYKFNNFPPLLLIFLYSIYRVLPNFYFDRNDLSHGVYLI